MRLRILLVCCAALALTVGVSAAVADTTIGQTGAPAALAFRSGIEIVSPGSVVPAGGGTIVSLNTQSSDCNTASGFQQGTYNFQVLHPLGGDQYKVLGETGNKTDPCDGLFHSYPVNIPVQGGDVLGVYVVAPWVGVLSTSGSIVYNDLSEPAVGDTVTLPIDNAFTVDESATLVVSPQSKDDCKNGGWQTLRDGNGKPFKNQGDCVSYVATKGKNTASG